MLGPDWLGWSRIFKHGQSQARARQRALFASVSSIWQLGGKTGRAERIGKWPDRFRKFYLPCLSLGPA